MMQMAMLGLNPRSLAVMGRQQNVRTMNASREKVADLDRKADAASARGDNELARDLARESNDTQLEAARIEARGQTAGLRSTQLDAWQGRQTAFGETVGWNPEKMAEWERNNPKPQSSSSVTSQPPSWEGVGQGDFDGAPPEAPPTSWDQPPPNTDDRDVKSATHELFKNENEDREEHAARVTEDLQRRFPDVHSDPAQREKVKTILKRIDVQPSELAELEESFGAGGFWNETFHWTPENRRVRLPGGGSMGNPWSLLPEAASRFGYGESNKTGKTRRKNKSWAGGFKRGWE